MKDKKKLLEFYRQDVYNVSAYDIIQNRNSNLMNMFKNI